MAEVSTQFDEAFEDAQRLAVVRGQLEAEDAARAAAEAAERAERSRREKAFEQLLAEAKHKHKRAVGWLDEDYGPLVFRRPAGIEMKRFVAEVSGDGCDASVAATNLSLACAYYPPREQMAAIIDELPGLPLQAAAEIQKLATATGQVRGKGSR